MPQQTGAPPLDEFLAKARPLNPGWSDADITREYVQSYGVPDNIGPLPTFEEFLPKAKAVNPGWSDTDIHQEWQDRYGVFGARETSSGLLRRAADIPIGITKGIVDLPKIAVGLADIPTGGAAGRATQMVLDAMGTDADQLGLPTWARPSQWSAELGKLYSPETQAARQGAAAEARETVETAKREGAGPLGQAAAGAVGAIKGVAKHPASIIPLVAENLPQMGVIAKGTALALKPLAAMLDTQVAAGAMTALEANAQLGQAAIKYASAGEGIMAAGQVSSQISEAAPEADRLSRMAAVIAGVTTAAITRGVAQIPGLGDVEATMAASALGRPAGLAGTLPQRIAKGILAEGLLQELPQSTQEQIWQNIATGKPWQEGIGEQAIQGFIAGGILGGSAAAAFGPSVVSKPLPMPTPAPPPEERELVAVLDQRKSLDESIAAAARIVESPAVAQHLLDAAIGRERAAAEPVIRGEQLPTQAQIEFVTRETPTQPPVAPIDLLRSAQEIAQEQLRQAESKIVRPLPRTGQPLALLEGAPATPAPSGIEIITPPRPKAEAEPDTREQIARERQRLIEMRERARVEREEQAPIVTPTVTAPVSVERPTEEAPLPPRLELTYPSVEKIHKLAEAKGIQWDENPAFLEMTRMVTGQTHLDDLKPAQRQRLYDFLNKINAKTGLPEGIERPKEPLHPFDAATVQRQDLAPRQNAELLARAEKARADMEIAGSERGGKNFDYDVEGQGGTPRVTAWGSATADWYKEATSGSGALSRERVEKAIAKIIADHGLDTGKDVQRIKQLLLEDREFEQSPFMPQSEAEWVDLVKVATEGRVIERPKAEAAPANAEIQNALDEASPLRTGQGEAEVDQSARNRSLAGTNFFGDRSHTEALLTKGFQSLHREAQHMVLAQVRTALNDNEIFRAVVKAVPIDVMNSLTGQQLSAQDLLHNPSVLTHRLSVSRDIPIPRAIARFIDALASTVNAITARPTTEEAGLRREPSPIELPRDTGSTVETAHGDEWHGEIAGKSVEVHVTPSEPQREAGVFKKGHIRISGLDITIENPAGTERFGVDRNGNPWQVKMRAHYGYIRSLRSANGEYVSPKGKDGDHLDVFVKPGIAEDYNGPVFVVDQVNPETGVFDELKTILGAETEAEAREMYLSNYSPGWQGLRAIRRFTMPEFKVWLKQGQMQKPATPAETPKAGQQEIAVPPPTIGQRPLIGREPTKEEAPLFSEAAKTPEPEQTVLPKELEPRRPRELAEAARPPIVEPIQPARTSVGTRTIDDIIREIMRLDQRAIAAYDPQRAVMKAGRHWSYALPDGRTHPGRYDTKHEAIEAAQRYKSLKQEQWDNPTDYYDLTQLLADESLQLIEKYQKAGLTEMEAGEKAHADILARYPELEYSVMKGYQLRQPEVPPTASAETPQAILANALRTAADQIEGKRAPIVDVGEKIGGARKDLAEQTGPKAETPKPAAEVPGWRKRYEVSQIVKSARGDEGKWTILDTRQKDFAGRPSRVGGLFDSKEEAEAMIPIAAVSRNHRVYRNREGQWEIYRLIGDRKRVKVVDQVFDTEEAAKRYLATHAEEIIETKTTFGEEILPRPETVRRIGPERREGRNVTADDFRQAFDFRAVEFGNWTNQDERQEVMNHAYDGLLDLAETLNIPPKAIGLNGELALAFGARGHGLIGAAAHYERNYGVINLTKMKGAGRLAHEWFHATDHYFGRQDTKAKSEKIRNERGDLVYPISTVEGDYISHGFSKTASGVRQEVQDAYRALIQTMLTKGERYVEDAQKAERFVAEARDDVAKFLNAMRNTDYLALSKQMTTDYRKKNLAPATAEQLAEFDGIAERILRGEFLETQYQVGASKSRRSLASGRWTNEALEKISAIYKAVRGRSGFGSGDIRGPLDDLRGRMRRYSERLKMLAEAQAGTEKTKQLPTTFAMEAKSIDQGRQEAYWMTNHEMAARAFEAYVEDRLKDQGRQSDFLVYGTHQAVPTPWGWRRPYPTGEERKAINQAFDRLFSILESQETERGTALREESAPYGVSEEPMPYRSEPVPTFFSQAERVLTQKMPNRASGEQVRGILSPTNGVKPDELKWIGLDDYLKTKDYFTKQDVLDFVGANQVQVQEVMKSDRVLSDLPPGYEVRNVRGRFEVWAANGQAPLADGATRDEAVRAAQDYLERVNAAPSWRRERETKFSAYQLPGGENYRELLLTLPVQRKRGELPPGYKIEKSKHLEMYWLQEPDGTTIASGYPSRERLLNDLDQILKDRGTPTPGAFIGGHFNEPNVLAHIRFNDRTTADGKKVLFLEEVQSDYAQRVRREGFKEELTFTDKGLPPAPFVGKTESWVGLALKRMLRYAAEHGYDSLAWTTGEQQSDRYDLSKQVDSIHVVHRPDHRFSIEAMRGGEALISKTVPQTELPDLIGKDLADKIARDMPEPGANDYSGLDLKIGGEGMKGFYDEIIPAFLNKYGKKWGARVEDLQLNQVTGEEPLTVHAAPITDAMRRSVLTEGQALFENVSRYAVREGESQRLNFDLAQAAVGDLDRTGQALSSQTGRVDRPVGARPDVTTVALGISPDLVHQGVVDLKGYRVASALDLAKLAQVYRDPRFETFRFIYTRGDTIVGHEGVTSRLPGTVMVFRNGDHRVKTLADAKARMKALGADGYWLLHNHPSGNSNPSQADTHITYAIKDTLPGFRGHVIIDSNEYSTIMAPDATSFDVTTHKADFGPERLLRPSINHPLLGNSLTSPADGYRIARSLQSPTGYVTVLYRGGGAGTVRAIQEMSVEFFLGPHARTYLMEQLTAFGAHDAITYYRMEDLSDHTLTVISNLSDQATTLVRDDILADHVVENAASSRYSSLSQQGVTVQPGMWYGRREADIAMEPVTEKAAPYTPTPPPSRSRHEHLGELTEAQREALTHVHGRPKTWGDTLNAFREHWKTELVQGLFDQYAPILDYTKKGYILARMTKGGEGTLEALLMYGKPYVDTDGAYRVDYREEDGMNGFSKVLAALHGEQDRFLEWVAAQRAGRLKEIGLEHLYTDEDIAALKTLNRGTMKDGSSREAAYLEALRELNDWNDAILKIGVDSGLISDDTRQLFKDTPYVPFYRLHEEGVIPGFGMKPGLVNQYAWKRLKGGTEHLHDDLLANLLKNWSHIITASAKNRAAKETLTAAAAAGVADEVPSSSPEKGLVHYMEAGKPVTFAVSDPALLDAIAALHYAGLGAIAKPFQAMKRYLSFAVTVNPAYKIRNLIRDSIQAIATTDLSYNPFTNIAQGAKGTTLASETRAQLLASGGMIRFGTMLDGTNADRTRRLIEQGVDADLILDDASKVTRFWKRYIQPAFEAYQEFGDRGEQVNRAALYEQLLTNGMNHHEASFWARDLMDFSLAGKWAAVRILTQIVPFMNARLQGLYKLGRAGKADYRRFGATLGTVALASIALMLAYKDDDDWKRREDWDRENYWWFKVGDLAVRIPKPFEIGALGTIAERSVEYLIEREMTGARFGTRLAATVANQLSMNPTPQLVKPLMDLYANKDAFTGRPIETMGMERLRKPERFTERTSEAAKLLGSLGLPDPTQLAMGRWNTLSPVQIDALVRGYFSWLGSTATTVVDYGIRPLVDRGERPTMKLRDVFLAGNFVETLPSGTSRYVTQLYEQAAEIEQAYGSFRDALHRGDREAAARIREEERGKLRLYPFVEQMKRQESALNTRIKMIESSRTLSGEQKRAYVDRLREQKHRLAKRLSERQMALR